MDFDVLLDLTPLDTESRLRGIGRYCHDLGRALGQLDEQSRGGLSIGAVTHLGGNVLGPLDWPGSDSPPLDGSKELAWYMQRRTKLAFTLTRLRPRLFHCTQQYGTPRTPLVPRVLTCHDLLYLVMRRQYIRSKTYGYLRHLADIARFRGSRRVIAISEFTAQDLMRLLGVPASRIDVVHNGVDHEVFHPAKTAATKQADMGLLAELGLDKKPFVVFLGGVDPRKGADVLVEAYGKAKLDSIDLVFVGHLPDEQAPRFAAWVDAAGRPPGLRHLGYLDDRFIPSILRGARALAFPSTYEGFGLPVLEAMAAGCPVITTHATSLREVAGDAACIVKPRDVETLKEALIDVARDDSLVENLRTAGLKQAAKFSWHKAALGTVDSYLNCLR